MTYNLISQRSIPGYELKLYDMAKIEWGKKTIHRYFVEKWMDDHSIPREMALVEKREYKSRTAALNKMRLEEVSE